MKTSLLQTEGMEYESDNEDHATIIVSYAEQRTIWNNRKSTPLLSPYQKKKQGTKNLKQK